MTTQSIPMYQGEDFAQQLSYFADVEQLVPLVIANPMMDVRAFDGTLIARFDTTTLAPGLCSVPTPGVLELTMGWTATALIPGGTYPLDIFADVTTGADTTRKAITKRGVIKLAVTSRITVDTDAL